MTGREKPQTPAYMRAQDAVLELVRSEGFAPGSKVPSERALASRLGLSRMTVRQGIENLVRAGVLIRAGTSGTHVADINVVRVIDSRRAFSMSQMVRILRDAARKPVADVRAGPGGSRSRRQAEHRDRPAGTAHAAAAHC